eukprot:CAMPEP_0201496560 /NCGR_PEP_ID=MMETSP0151_2-20130828/60462_1 /ASSEMBLY_ACC=CAM_ASM_000257 /TAXON_ID=200890 /ORGANISM="Paramoeba atlantica, Strain 621/1 / CCAP 1560/9" /LENGTH=40 /DNA_ID= /DNA_START= /DNA_END= /DNA_ORIENTATION=
MSIEAEIGGREGGAREESVVEEGGGGEGEGVEKEEEEEGE